MMLISKNDYLKGFGITVVVLALVRCVFPSVAKDYSPQHKSAVDTVQGKDTADISQPDTTASASSAMPLMRPELRPVAASRHPILGVSSYSRAFPDSNDVQMTAARLHGVEPVANRHEAEQRKDQWVYVGASPFYTIDKLRSSIPYLVPRAAVLLHDMGRSFFDSLQVKEIPLHQIIVTSVTRSEEDLEHLKKVNHNTSENSCHLYGTTFDVSYNRYVTVSDPDGPPRREVQNDTLKWVLSEVLCDLRQQERCYVKYEVKQGCFHITVR